MSLAFTPSFSTVNISVSSSSQSVALGYSGGPRQVRIMNNGTATVWVNFGESAVTASTSTSFPVGPGVTEVLTVPNFATAPYAAVIAAGSTGLIYFTPGAGI